MSRIGYAMITLPDAVEIKVEGTIVTVKGKKGELTQEIDPGITVNVKDGEVTLERASEAKDLKAKHGLYRSLINNMIIGVSEGFQKQLELHGVGYRAAASGQQLEISVGYSHPIIIEFPSEIKVSAETAKGKPPLVTMESHDNQLLGQAAAKLRSLRKPEPYKGKGIRFKGEFIRRKAGKAAAK